MPGARENARTSNTWSQPVKSSHPTGEEEALAQSFTTRQEVTKAEQEGPASRRTIREGLKEVASERFQS